MKNLVIVESPAKAKTIEKILGPGFKVLSSYGHIRDLKKKGISIDFDNDFAPQYEIPSEKKELVSELTKASREAETVWLASDEDREGEAIAWHLAEVLGLDPKTTRRIVFHEITKPAIQHAIENPRSIDIDRVNAQQARRVLDRIVGFELSPVLWKKIKPALSAGRVQSVAVRLICEREKEINSFRTETYYRLNAIFRTAGKGSFRAELSRRLASKEEAVEFLDRCDRAAFRIGDVSVHPLKRSPLPPFTTSTLQQEASKRLGFSVKRTMSVAQRLYEAGLITYMRTDSVNLSKLAMSAIADQVKSIYGAQFYKARTYHTASKGAQEAHEAIRPTYMEHRSIDADRDGQRLYDLIWKRTMACQMADAMLEKTSIDIDIVPGSPEIYEKQDRSVDGDEVFKAEGTVVRFPGFMEVWAPESENRDDGHLLAQEGSLPPVGKGEELKAEEIVATQRFTQAPPRYSEATLVKKMEDLGIGRPSTYAPTISTIQERDYIKKGDREGSPRDFIRIIMRDGRITEEVKSETTGSDKGRLVPTDVGMIVNDFLTENFPDILDYNFTARIEGKFDEIAEGKLAWQDELGNFYADFHPGIERIDSLRMDHKVGERLLGEDPKSGKPVSVKIGRYGPMVQIGSSEDEEKPQFASLEPGMSVSTITLEEALRLFELPRVVGEYEGSEVKASAGRFGPYIQIGKEYVSIPKDLSPHTITIEEAAELIRAKREKDASKFIKEFGDELPGAQVLNGRYGPYIAYKPEGAKKAVNYKIPKTTDPATLSVADVRSLIEAQDAAPKTPRSRSRKK